jgi:outer membrane protein TolC
MVSRSVSLSLALFVGASAARAQQPASQPANAANQSSRTVTLSLDDALRLAPATSQNVDVARAGVTRASGGKYQARAQFLPQLNATGSYNRTLKSQFSGLASSSNSSSSTGTGTTGGTTDTTGQRPAGGGFDLSKTSFAAANLWTFGLSFSQNLFTGGRVTAQNTAANAQLASAQIELTAQQAQASLDVTQAYYDAVLADQLVSIADSSVSSTKAVLAQTELAKKVGNASEYELLRAQVTYQNQLPVAIQARSNREVAYLHLKQLLNMPLDDALRLTTGIEGPNGPTLPAIAQGPMSDTSASVRAPVRELDEAVRGAEAQVKIARAERIPNLALVSNYQRLYFPSTVFPTLNQGVNNWTVGFSTNFPIFDGGRIKGDQLIAQAGVQQAKAQREQTRQFAALDARTALNALQEAQSTWDASRGTAEQAQRAYAIDQVRFREGISTQTDLSQSRLLLEQALANRAQAARNLAVARVKLALLRDLPLTSATIANGSTQGGAAGSSTAQQQQQQQQSSAQQQRTTTTNPAAGAAGGFPGSIQP